MRCYSAMAVVVCLAAWCLCSTASAGTFTWTRAADSDGWWDTKLIPETNPPEYMNNWGRSGDPPAFPDAGDDAIISKAVEGWNVSLSPTASVHDLTVGSDDSLTVSAILTVYGDSISNAGQITIDQTSVITSLRIDHVNTVLSGGGALTLTDNNENTVKGKDGDERLTNVDNTISGGGHLGVGDLALTNHALINANVVATLLINPNAGGVINTGTMQASDGGTLRLYEQSCLNTGAVIQALDGSEVMLDNVAVTDGTVSTSGSGIVTIHHQTTLQDVQNTGNMQATGSTIILNGTFTNTGNVEAVHPLTLYTRIRVDGTVTLNGGGTITLGGSKVLVEGSGGGGDLNNVDNTISGAGYLGYSTLGSLTNTGTIQATGTNVLQVDLLGTAGMTNDGTMRAIGSGGLYFTDDTFTNTATVEVFSSSELKVRVGGSGDYFQTDGTTWLDNGAVLKAKNVYVQGGSVVGAGTLDTINVIVTDGTVAPGLSPGLLTVTGNYTQSDAGSLEIELGGLAQGTQYDLLDVGGIATLDGELEIVLWGGFVPSLLNSFEVMTYGSRAGVFSTITGNHIPGGLILAPDYGAASLVLVATVPGDANLDGSVDLLDLGIVGDNWNGTGKDWGTGDFNGDGVVDLLDLGVVGDNWNTVYLEGAATPDSVPEPSTIALLGMGAVGLLTCIRRRRQHVCGVGGGRME